MAKTPKRTTPAGDEAVCAVAPLARELARIIRVRKEIKDEDKGAALLSVTDPGEDIGSGPLSREYADNLLVKRLTTIEELARQLHATSRIGAAFQLLLAHSDNLKCSLPGASWDAAPKDLQERSTRMDMERQGMLWAVYKATFGSWKDPDLATLETMLGFEGLTDGECVERVLQAAA